MKIGSDTVNPFITLRCNYDCEYCITRYSNYNFPAPSEEKIGWVDALNSLEDVKNYIINGGEPTLHPEFLSIMDGLKPCGLLAVGTNCSPPAFEVLKRMPHRKEIVVDISYHPRQRECSTAVLTMTDQLIERAVTLQETTRNRVRVHAVSWPGYKDQYQMVLLNKFKAAGLETFPLEFEGMYDGKFHYSGGNACMSAACDLVAKRKAKCFRTIFLPVSPKGDVYFCHALMYATSPLGILGNVFTGWMTGTQEIICDQFGLCNPCDKRRIEPLG